jgi:hypothetical protein
MALGLPRPANIGALLDRETRKDSDVLFPRCVDKSTQPCNRRLVLPEKS